MHFEFFWVDTPENMRLNQGVIDWHGFPQETCLLSHIRIHNKSVLEWEISIGLRNKVNEIQANYVKCIFRFHEILLDFLQLCLWLCSSLHSGLAFCANELVGRPENASVQFKSMCYVFVAVGESIFYRTKLSFFTVGLRRLMALHSV